jgi:hypothetical protein
MDNSEKKNILWMIRPSSAKLTLAALVLSISWFSHTSFYSYINKKKFKQL